jgi:hypothetical protein
MRFGGRGFQRLAWITSVLAAAACADASDARAQAAVPSQGGPVACMPDPSACGYPDLETTGVTPGTPLSPVNGVVTLNQPGQVFQNAVVTGSIAVTAQNVTIRNVKLIASNPSGAAIGVRPGQNWDRTDANLLVERVEIDMNGLPNIKGIGFNGYTLRNVFMHNGADCAHFSRNVVIQESLCVIGPDVNGDAVPDSGEGGDFCRGASHFDGFQYGGGGSVTLDHNTVRNPCGQTAAMLITNDPGFSSPITNVAITNNLMAGGGYTLYCADSDDSVASETVTGNRFARTYFQRGGRFGPTTYCDRATTFAGNIWDGTETLIPGSAPGTGGGAGGGGGGGSPSSPGTTPAAPVYALERRRARRITRAALARALGARYRRHAERVRMRCGRRAPDAFVCKVKWAGRNRRGVRHRYHGRVRVRRVGPSSWRYVLRIEDWSGRCRCSSTIKRARRI